jgi:hypothetical protein
LAALAILAGVLALADTGRIFFEGSTATSTFEHAAAPGTIPDWNKKSSARLVYPFSVIPGGVTSVAELREAIARDPVVAAHYARFDLGKARVIRLAGGESAYVSYRRGNQVYWTSRKVKLATGEMVITDGLHTARSRCGNQVSDIPDEPFSEEEPPAETLDTPGPPDTASIPVQYPFDAAPNQGNLTEPVDRGSSASCAGAKSPIWGRTTCEADYRITECPVGTSQLFSGIQEQVKWEN